jgi:hypothetical protein
MPIMIRYSFLVFLLALSSCSQQDEAEEVDYDNLVLLDEEDDEWTPGQDSDSKEIADLDPQEFMIFDPELKTENALEEIR